MQYFYIKQGSTLPTIRMELIEDGRHDFHKFHECIQGADITFTMVNIDTNVTKVAKGNLVLNYSYDGWGNLVSLEYPDHKKDIYEYDSVDDFFKEMGL